MSGAMSSWNSGLEAGFQSFLLCVGIMTVGYTCLVMCLAELTSITAFAGGNYGYARCSIGPAYGYLFACFEWGKNSVFTVGCLSLIAEAITYGFEIPNEIEPLWVLLLYLVLLCFLLPGGHLFWRMMNLAAGVSVSLLIIYLVSGMTKCKAIFRIEMDHRDHHGFDGGVAKFMEKLMYGAWFYIGVESVTVAGAKIGNGIYVIPKAMIAAQYLFVMVAFWITSVVYFGYTGKSPAFYLYTAQFPLMFGFKDHLEIIWRYGALLSTPPMLGSALGWLYSSVNIFHAMALSGLLPPWLKPVAGEGRVPVRAILALFLIQYLFYLFAFYVGILNLIFPFTMMGACWSYIGIFAAYLTFQTRFPTMTRHWVAPMGQYAAYVGIVVFLLVFVSIIGFHEHNHFLSAFLVGFVALSMTYYFVVAEKRQFFSHEEQQKFFKAYILNGKYGIVHIV